MVVGAATPWWHSAERPSRTFAVSESTGTAGFIGFCSLVAFTAVLLLAPQEWFPGLARIRLAFVLGAVASGAYVAERAARTWQGPRTPREIRIALALLAWALITVPVSYWPSGSVAVLSEHYFKAVVFFWLVSALVTSPARVQVFAWSLALCAVPLAVTGLYHFRTGRFATLDAAPVQRIVGYVGGSGLAENPNDLALLLNLLIPISGALLLTARRNVARLVAALTLVLGIAGVIVTFSRAGFLTLAVILLAALAHLLRRRMAGAAVGLIASGLLALPLLPSEYVARLSTISEISSDETGSAQGRWADFQTSAEIVQDHPIVGVGIGQDILALNEYRGPTWRSVHNVYLQYAVDLGLPGLLLFLWLMKDSFQSAKGAERMAARLPDGRGLGGMAAGVRVSLTAFAVAAFFHPMAYQFYFFIVAGLAVALRSACLADLRRLPEGDVR